MLKNTLLLDTSTNFICLGYLDDKDRYFDSIFYTNFQHERWILTQLDYFLKSLAVKINDLEYIGYGVGPGSFTATRIGINAAHGFCAALNKTRLEFSSLLALAITQNQSKVKLVLSRYTHAIGNYDFTNNLQPIISEEINYHDNDHSLELAVYSINDHKCLIDLQGILPYLVLKTTDNQLITN